MREFEFVPERREGCKVRACIHYQNGSEEIVQKNYPAVIICPGGAYAGVSDREAEPVAIPFFAAGYNTFILNYSVGSMAGGFRPLCQLAATISEIRKHADEFAHVMSIENVSGAKEGSEQYQWFGLDRRVDKHTPPTFLWHTAEDSCVPVENSLKMAGALSAKKIPFELHVFPKGEHGMSICTEEVGSASEHNARWVEWCIKWLQSL